VDIQSPCQRARVFLLQRCTHTYNRKCHSTPTGERPHLTRTATVVLLLAPTVCPGNSVWVPGTVHGALSPSHLQQHLHLRDSMAMMRKLKYHLKMFSGPVCTHWRSLYFVALLSFAVTHYCLPQSYATNNKRMATALCAVGKERCNSILLQQHFHPAVPLEEHVRVHESLGTQQMVQSCSPFSLLAHKSFTSCVPCTVIGMLPICQAVVV